MTVRVPAWSRALSPAAEPVEVAAAAAWADTLAALAAEHQARRAADVDARWPLGHRCATSPGVPNEAPGRRGSAFCCRALA